MKTHGNKENLGQHFLIDKEVLKKEIDVSSLNEEDKVIEIGAGRGILTEELSKKSGSVLAFESDEKLSEFLGLIEKKHSNLKVVYGDALKFSWKGYNKIVSNIPYHLSEAVILKAIEFGIDELVLIVGENFKEKIEEDREKIGMLVNVFFEFMPVTKVKSSSFFPQPRVDSWLIKLTRKTKSTKQERILQSMFLKKGKIKNAIINSLTDEGITKRKAREIVSEMNLNEYASNKPMASITGRVLMQIRENLASSQVL